MNLINLSISVSSTIILVGLITFIKEKNKPSNYLIAYLWSGALTTIIVVFIVVFIIALLMRNGDLATEVWSVYFIENIFANIIAWLIITPLTKCIVERGL